MKSHKKLIIAVLLLIGLGAVSTALGIVYYAYTPITAVEINSHSDNDTVFAGGEFAVTCTTSTDRDKYCDSSGWHYPWDPVTHTWSGDGQGFVPGTGTSVTWTAPTATGGADIMVTANDSPLYNEPAKTDTVTLTVTNIIYVDTDATGKNDGSSWADAFVYLQDALTAADNANVSDNEIWIAEETYYPDDGDGYTAGYRFYSFQLVDHIEMYGGFDGTETSRGDRNYVTNVTILSGDIDHDDVLDAGNSYHVVKGAGDANTVIDGFTITKGYGTSDGAGMYNYNCSPAVANCILTGNKCDGGDADGGAMHNRQSSPTVTNCTFTYNVAGDDGGAVSNKQGSNGTFTNCTFSNNSTEGDNKDEEHPEGKSDGGAVHNSEGEYPPVTGSSPIFTNCTFSDNNTVRDGGAVCNTGTDTDPCFINCTFTNNKTLWYDGGAMCSIDSSCPIVTDCNFVSNSAGADWTTEEDQDGDGGAVANKNDSDGSYTDCEFTDNSANDDGGAVHNTTTDDPCGVGSSPTFTDCIFGTTTIGDRNSATNDGGAVHNKGDGTDPTFINCIITGNYAGDDGGGMACRDGSSAIVTDCIFWNNDANDNGGAIFNSNDVDIGSCPVFTSCVIVGNDTVNRGGGACNSGSLTNPTYINCTFTQNHASNDGGAMVIKDSSFTTATNCILWNDSADDDDPEIRIQSGGVIVVTYSDVEGGYAGTGNRNVDPNFVNTGDLDGADDEWKTSDDGLVINDTRCIDAANGNVDPTTDILGNSRYDDSSWSNVGTGDPSYVDMGAYEYQGS